MLLFKVGLFNFIVTSYNLKIGKKQVFCKYNYLEGHDEINPATKNNYKKQIK